MGGRRKSKLIADVLGQIIQQDDETNEEFVRRRNRERRRAYRALIPKGPKRLRGPDKQLRKNAAPPEVREALEALPGETEEDRRRRYQRLNVRNWRTKNRKRDIEKRRALQRSEKHKAKKAEWLIANEISCYLCRRSSRQ